MIISNNQNSKTYKTPPLQNKRLEVSPWFVKGLAKTGPCNGMLKKQTEKTLFVIWCHSIFPGESIKSHTGSRMHIHHLPPDNSSTHLVTSTKQHKFCFQQLISAWILLLYLAIFNSGCNYVYVMSQIRQSREFLHHFKLHLMLGSRTRSISWNY